MQIEENRKMHKQLLTAISEKRTMSQAALSSQDAAGIGNPTDGQSVTHSGSNHTSQQSTS